MLEKRDKEWTQEGKHTHISSVYHQLWRRPWHPLQYSCLENPMDRGAWWAAVHWVAQLSNFTFTFHSHALEKEMATHSSVLAWRIPGMAEPGGLLSMGSHRVRRDWSNLAAYHHLYLKAAWLNICSNKLISPSWDWQDKQLKCQSEKKKCNEEAERGKGKISAENSI